METTGITSAGGIVVHSWEPDSFRSNPPSVIPEKIVSAKARDVKLLPIKTGLGKRKRAWKVSEVMFSGHKAMLSVVGDLRPADFKRVVVYALEFEDMLNRYIGAEAVGIPYRIKIFADREEYKKVAEIAGAPTAASYYSPRERSIVSFFDPKVLTASYGGPVMTHEDVQALLSHEFTHAFMDIVWDQTGPVWFAEGMACYFQHFAWTGGRAVPGALSKRDLQIILMNETLPLADFVKLGRNRMYGAEFPQLYAQAWAVTHYLQNSHPYMIRALLGGDAVDVRGLEEEWKGYLDRMLEKAGVS